MTEPLSVTGIRDRKQKLESAEYSGVICVKQSSLNNTARTGGEKRADQN